MNFIKNLILISKIIIITFFFSLLIDFFFGKKILDQFESFFLKSQFGEKLIRIDHPVYHHTLRENIVYSSNVSFIGTYELCTNNFGFKSKCKQIDIKKFEYALIGDSFTEGTPIEYNDTFVGVFAEKTGYKTANDYEITHKLKFRSKTKFITGLKENIKHLFSNKNYETQ